jgi:hypothetical protein
VDELKKVSQHQDEIEARYEETASLKILQEFKENVPLAYKDLPIYVQELFKRFEDLKNQKLVKIGKTYLDKKEIDLESERLSDHLEEVLLTLKDEKMYVESIFREKNGEDDYLY